MNGTRRHLNRSYGTEKSTWLRKCFFQLNPPMAEEIHLRWMKSLHDEIYLTAGDGGGFNFIWGETPKISSERSEDFIVQRTISFPFGSVAGFEPAKCIFWYRFTAAQKLWTDSNRHTLSKAFRKSSRSKFIYKAIDAKAFWTDLNYHTTPPAKNKVNPKKMQFHFE